jgi:hypothetical protein
MADLVGIGAGGRTETDFLLVGVRRAGGLHGAKGQQQGGQYPDSACDSHRILPLVLDSVLERRGGAGKHAGPL